jgi:hypothetical protein
MGQERPVTARDLDQIVVRVLRGGKWLNGFVGELDYLTEEEIASTIPSLGNVIRALLNDSVFGRSMCMFCTIYLGDHPARLPETCIGWFGKRLDEMGVWRLSLRVANAWIS